MSKVNITTAVNIEVDHAERFEDLFDYAENIVEVEGKNLHKRVAKMSVAAGDLAATIVDGFETGEPAYDEVAGLILRAATLGLSLGMTAEDLKSAIARETMRMLRESLGDRVAKMMDKSGFECDGVAVVL